MIGVANDNLWRKFCPIAGLDEIVDDPRFRTNPDRVAHRAETISRVQAAVATQPVAYWYERLSEVGVPCSPINTLQQLVDHPHTRNSDVVVRYEHPVAGPTTSVGPPYKLNGQARTAGTPPPTHGQHTDEVLREMGLSANDIEKLRAAQVIG
jgi:crotonobetainyl-CoA:carnitine CoA-transferase CaiB-like acyl-CoA transferase